MSLVEAEATPNQGSRLGNQNRGSVDGLMQGHPEQPGPQPWVCLFKDHHGGQCVWKSLKEGSGGRWREREQPTPRGLGPRRAPGSTLMCREDSRFFQRAREGEDGA